MSEPATTLERRHLPPRGQAITIVFATLASILWGVVTHLWFPDKSIPAWPTDPWWAWTCLGVGVVTIIYLATSSDSLAPWFLRGGYASFQKGRVGRVWARIEHPVVVATLFAITGGCVALLGGYTVPTGGAIHSPYRDSLLALALLSPFIARRVWTPLVVLVMVAAAYIGFSEIVDPEVPVHATVPLQIHALTTLASAVVAILAATLVRVYERPRKTDVSGGTNAAEAAEPAARVETGAALPVIRRPANRTVEITHIHPGSGGFRAITKVRIEEKENGPAEMSVEDLVRWLLDDGRNRAVIRDRGKIIPVLVFANKEGRWLRTSNGINWTDQLQTLPRY